MTSEWGFVRALAGFAAGVVIALLDAPLRAIAASTRRYAVDVVVVGVILLMMLTIRGPWLYATLIPFVVLVALIMNDEGIVARLLSMPLSQTLGRLSYSMYLLHGFIAVLLVDGLRYALPGGSLNRLGSAMRSLSFSLL